MLKWSASTFKTLNLIFSVRKNMGFEQSNSNLAICQLESSLTAQQTIFTRHVENSKKATIASLKISHMLEKKKKPFIDGPHMNTENNC